MKEKLACGDGPMESPGARAGFQVASSPTEKWKAREEVGLVILDGVMAGHPTAADLVTRTRTVSLRDTDIRRTGL